MSLKSTPSIFSRFFWPGTGEPGHPQKFFDKFSECFRKRKRFDIRRQNLVSSRTIPIPSPVIFSAIFWREVRERERLKFSKKSTGGKRGETSRVPLITNYKFLYGMSEGIGTKMQWQRINFSFSNRWALLPSQSFTPFFEVFRLFSTKKSKSSRQFLRENFSQP